MKPGDVVTLNVSLASRQRWYPDWKAMNWTGPYVIVGPLWPGDEYNVTIAFPDGTLINWDPNKFNSEKAGIDISWLRLDPFLTAANGAISDETEV